VARQAIEQKVAVLIPDTTMHPDQSLVRSAAQQHIRSALCVPVTTGEEILALLYVYKSRPLTHPFGQRDLQLAVAIGHQASLTIQRTRLLERLRQEQEGRQLFQRFLSPEETEIVLPDYLKTGKLPEVTERILTVLFVDIRDATGLAARLGPRRFSALLSKFFQQTLEVVFGHHGLLVQFTGDGLLAVFGMFGRPEPEVRAVEAALAMVARLVALNHAEGETMELGIGINTGAVLAGYLDVKNRFEFSLLGRPVNVAQQLEQHASGNRVLIGPSTASAIGDKINLTAPEKIEIKGTGPLQVHEVLRG